MGRLFGTDGVRGLANRDLTPELAMSLAVAAAHVLVARRSGSRRPVAVVGRDPRASGEFLEAAVVAGLASAGVDVVRLGVLPTPGVAYLAGALSADLGVMLSASHNAMPDNGIKFFDSSGFKLPDPVEDEIQRQLGQDWERPIGAEVGRVRDEPAATRRYTDHLLSTISTRLDGLRVVVDCANGAASAVAPAVLAAAGAQVTTLAADPDGLNINDGVGSTHPEALRGAVLHSGADVGIGHDGDADRCLAVDADGRIVDGDAILAICATAAADAGRLAERTVVTTVMTNLGFKRAMSARGISVVQTPVGDRYVLEALQRCGLNLGGEQSGHVVFLDHATTGDGVLTALQLLARMASTGRPLAELASLMERLPQVLVNVPGVNRSRADAPELLAAVAAAEADLGADGRVLVRASGTEPLIRVMVEATTPAQATSVAESLARVVESACR